MGSRYWISGVQLGMLRTWAKLFEHPDYADDILIAIEENQFIGNIELLKGPPEDIDGHPFRFDEAKMTREEQDEKKLEGPPRDVDGEPFRFDIEDEKVREIEAIKSRVEQASDRLKDYEPYLTLGSAKLLLSHIEQLEEGIAIAYDYLKAKYDMDSVPLNKITELYKLIEKEKL